MATPNDCAMVLSAVTNELAFVRLSVGTAASAVSCGGVMTIGTIPRAGTLRRWALCSDPTGDARCRRATKLGVSL
jgi:hypothetical protein